MPEHTDRASDWMKGDGPFSDVVMSSRVRLARNLAGFPFLSKTSATQRREIACACRDHLMDSGIAESMLWVDLPDSSEMDRQILVERHLISRQHAKGGEPRGVAIALDESVSVMVNEEDHLRIGVLRSGMQLDDGFAHANQIDDLLEQRAGYAYSSRFGYLTACPTNVGSGIRISVMLHLPALVMTGEIEKVKQAANDMHLAVRGFHGEGTEATGDLYQISNQTTLGRTEQEMLADFQREIIPKVIEYEHAARQAMADRRTYLLDDRIHRAQGVLTSARLLSSSEALALLSHLRLGVSMGRIADIELGLINELILLTQPAHLQRIAGGRLDGEQRREFRAEFVRRRLTGG